MMMAPSLLLDWVESMALCANMRPWSDVVDMIQDSLGTDHFRPQVIGSEYSNDDCYPIDETLREVLRTRQEVLGPMYPFRFGGHGRFEVVPGFDLVHSSYILLLGISLLHLWKKDVADALKCGRESLEFIVAEAFKTKGYAADVMGTAGDPGGFSKKISRLGKDLGIPVDPNAAVRSRWDKDENVDVVAVDPFRDGRKGEFFFLVQATCGTTIDWCSKLGEIRVSAWRDYLLEKMQPVCYVAVPYHVSAEEASILVEQNSYSSFLDRTRIVQMWGSVSVFSDDGGQELFDKLKGHFVKELGFEFFLSETGIELGNQ